MSTQLLRSSTSQWFLFWTIWRWGYTSLKSELLPSKWRCSFLGRFHLWVLMKYLKSSQLHQRSCCYVLQCRQNGTILMISSLGPLLQKHETWTPSPLHSEMMGFISTKGSAPRATHCYSTEKLVGTCPLKAVMWMYQFPIVPAKLTRYYERPADFDLINHWWGVAVADLIN